MKLGEQMNLTGTDLKEFIREQQILAREEREKEREREREREEREKERKREQNTNTTLSTHPNSQIHII